MFDLAVDQASAIQNSNGKWDVTYDLSNNGFNPIRAAQVGFYQSKDLVIDRNDRVIGTQSYYQIAVSETREITLKNLTFNPNSGNHLLIKGDPRNRIAEATENNNLADVPVGLDLSVINGKVTLNQDYLHVQYRISHDGIPSVRTMSKVYLDGREISALPIFALDENRDSQGCYHIIKLDPQAKGQHEIKVVVDPDNLSRESNEQNNTWLFPLNLL